MLSDFVTKNKTSFYNVETSGCTSKHRFSRQLKQRFKTHLHLRFVVEKPITTTYLGSLGLETTNKRDSICCFYPQGAKADKVAGIFADYT
jgi:hypothetical protein